MTETEKFCFFWRTHSPFSQWHASKFKGTSPYGGKEQQFNNAEQWMMYNKALLFEDWDVAKQIMRTTDPRKTKALGRKVKGFKDKTWKKHRKQIILTGNLLKFTQSENLRHALLGAKGTLVEASPHDKIYGIGLGESDPRAKSRSTWKGLNLLGFCLTDLRDLLLAQPELQDPAWYTVDGTISAQKLVSFPGAELPKGLDSPDSGVASSSDSKSDDDEEMKDQSASADKAPGRLRLQVIGKKNKKSKLIVVKNPSDLDGVLRQVSRKLNFKATTIRGGKGVILTGDTLAKLANGATVTAE